MSTSKEDTSTPGEAPASSTSPDASDTSDTSNASDASGAFVSGTPVSPVPALGGVFSAESFSGLGLLLLAPVLVNSRLFTLFAWFGLTDAGTATAEEVALFNAEITVAGGLSALAVLVGALSLFLGNARTRAWARWGASATVLAGTVFVILAVITLVSVPAAG
ncbi:hypothetical protein DFP74_0192 [Nocardiopsis sp. Huas11]|uniref:hypothetical protein n=1 Tax=Nocardiopsis sp. Huas11 TaxID=2183912 RepID=UPI000EAC4FB1|nr:hypothetical protein [Nocardiopsis sp. Huas11]RKS04632.1 hypothetical protein DFP74_0192 [Nocardiopsis sp. Huas11]